MIKALREMAYRKRGDDGPAPWEGSGQNRLKTLRLAYYEAKTVCTALGRAVTVYILPRPLKADGASDSGLRKTWHLC